ncbi:hypothetical protein L208DRAFT_1418490 [Tricholoma matsutake]|nr:hypothetical protein L208DRAFT_1418490 [Tricholoma matsutake 945]
MRMAATMQVPGPLVCFSFLLFYYFTNLMLVLVTTRWEGVPPKLNLSSFLLFCPHLLLLTTFMNRVQWSREQNSGDAHQ